MNCPNCGQTARPESARCSHCNYKLPVNTCPPAGSASSTVACWNCSQPNPSDAERCNHCNAKVADRADKPQNGSRFSFTQYAVSHDE
jgi:hypothetical protein